MPPSTTVVRKRQARPCRPMGNRRRKRVSSSTGWAYVPAGSRLEARLQRLLLPVAESRVRAALASTKSLSTKPTSNLAVTTRAAITVTNSEKNNSNKSESHSEADAAPISSVPLATPDEWKIDLPPSSQDVQDAPPPVSMPSSQMSEGLEILLLASQESVDFSAIGKG